MSNLPLPGMKLTPLGWPLMSEAYLGCVSWAMTESTIKQAFKSDTGHDLDEIANARGLDKLIDDSTGRSQAVLAAFMDFVTRTVWGEDPAQ